MNYDKILKIIEDIKTINRGKAVSLAKLVQKHMDETDTDKAYAIEKKINDIIYGFFVNLLDKDSKYKIYDLGCEIFEECANIQQDARNGWVVNFKGAFRYVENNDKCVLVNSLPRTYKVGYHLTDNSGVEAIDFNDRYSDILKVISRMMDTREETITFTKKPKNKNISSELIDEIIDYLNLPKVAIEEDESLLKKEFIK